VHDVLSIQVTSKGAGGTGKTTTAWSLAEGLARAGQRVLLLNTDSQPSVEERLLGKLVHMSFGGDYDLFYELNGLERQQTLRGGLFALRNFEPPGVGQVPTPVPRRAVEVDVERVASPNHQQGRCREGQQLLRASVAGWLCMQGPVELH
jgi:cellulose biosynthesis protein BcsQ